MKSSELYKGQIVRCYKSKYVAGQGWGPDKESGFIRYRVVAVRQSCFWVDPVCGGARVQYTTTALYRFLPDTQYELFQIIKKYYGE
jgi:hypothetical protein